MYKKAFETNYCQSLSMKSYQNMQIETACAIGKRVTDSINKRFDAYLVGYWLTRSILASLP